VSGLAYATMPALKATAVAGAVPGKIIGAGGEFLANLIPGYKKITTKLGDKYENSKFSQGLRKLNFRKKGEYDNTETEK